MFDKQIVTHFDSVDFHERRQADSLGVTQSACLVNGPVGFPAGELSRFEQVGMTGIGDDIGKIDTVAKDNVDGIVFGGASMSL